MNSARLATRLFGTGNVLVIHRFTLDLVGGDHLAALFLEQLVYWTERTSDPDGWIVKTYSEWEREIGLSKYLVGRIAETLAPFGVETSVRRSTFHRMQPVVHYRVNLSVLDGKILTFIESEKPSLSESQKRSLSESETPSLSITETTTETTPEEDAGAGMPDHIPPHLRRIIEYPEQTPIANPDGGAMKYQIVEAYCDAWDIVVERYRKAVHRDQDRYAGALADMGATPEDVAELCKTRRASGKSPAEYGLRLVQLDWPGWKSYREANKPQPRVISDIERAAAEQELEAERTAWRKDQGLL